MNLFTITVPGKPIAKKRPRFFRRGEFVGTYNDQRTAESRFMWECQAQLMKIGWITPIARDLPVELVCKFYFDYPKKERNIDWSTTRFYAKRPDLDNLVKFIKDCFNSFVWHDDAQVVRISALKFYGLVPRTEISVGTMEKE